MSDQWSDILETYHLASCPAPDEPCTCRLCEVIEDVAQLETDLKIEKQKHLDTSNWAEEQQGRADKAEAENERLKRIERYARSIAFFLRPVRGIFHSNFNEVLRLLDETFGASNDS